MLLSAAVGQVVVWRLDPAGLVLGVTADALMRRAGKAAGRMTLAALGVDVFAGEESPTSRKGAWAVSR